MTLQANQLGFGEGSFGGSPFGSGGEPVVAVVSPADGATLVSTLADYVFQVLGDLFNFGALNVTIHGVPAVTSGVAQPGVTLRVGVISGGWQFTVSRSAPLPLSTAIACVVSFYDGEDLVTLSTSYTTITPFTFLSVTVLDKRTLRFTFNREPKDEGTLYERGNYEIEVRTGIKRRPQVLSITHQPGTSYVDATLLDYLPSGGDYRATVRHIRDTYLVEITP